MMSEEIKIKFPSWCNSNEYFDLCLTNDLDSLLSCRMLEKVKGWRINYFYDFYKLYRIEKRNSKCIGVDLGLLQGKTWDNHITTYSAKQINPESANINNVNKVSATNYHDKYCGSTLLQIMAYYNIPLPASEEGKVLLLAIDSSFLGHYSNKFRQTQQDYLKMLGLADELLPIIERHKKQDFVDITYKFGLKKEIYINEENQLETKINLPAIGRFFNMDLSLPNENFEDMRTFKPDKADVYSLKDMPEENLFSAAFIYRNTLKYSAFA